MNGYISVGIQSDVRLPFASGKFGTIEDIGLLYDASGVQNITLHIRDLHGKLVLKQANEVRPMDGTLSDHPLDDQETGVHRPSNHP